MKQIESVIYYLEELKIPINSEFSPEDWKDWYHYILFDPVHQIRLLFNLSFSGRPKLGQITTTVQLTFRRDDSDVDYQSYGFMKIESWEEKPKQKLPLQLSIPGLLDIELTSKFVNVKVQRSNGAFVLQFTGIPLATPILIPELFPYGSGFIGWGFIPGLAVEGELRFNDRCYPITKEWFCYHDHNFGRFRWGDEDVGWVWWVATLQTKCGTTATIVFHRGNNKNFSKIGSPYLFIYFGNELVKSFLGNSINIAFYWANEPQRLPILPGGMSSVFSHRKVLVPRQIKVKARDELDDVEIILDIEAKLEIILPDYQTKQYTFLKEMNGTAKAAFKINNRCKTCESGMFYAEYVH